MNAKLVVVGGDAKATEITLKLPTVVGRGRDVSLTLPHPLVSRKHCEIFASNGRLFIRDFGSLNGTFVNSERIEGEVEISSGELLTIGSVTFRVEYDFDPDILPPTEATGPSEVKVSETVRDPAAATIDIRSGVDVEAELDDEAFAEFGDLSEDDEFADLGEDEDWADLSEDNLQEAGSELPPAADEDVRATKPAPETNNKSETDDDAGEDDLNAFFKGLD